MRPAGAARAGTARAAKVGLVSHEGTRKTAARRGRSRTCAEVQRDVLNTVLEALQIAIDAGALSDIAESDPFAAVEIRAKWQAIASIAGGQVQASREDRGSPRWPLTKGPSSGTM